MSGTAPACAGDRNRRLANGLKRRRVGSSQLPCHENSLSCTASRGLNRGWPASIFIHNGAPQALVGCLEVWRSCAAESDCSAYLLPARDRADLSRSATASMLTPSRALRALQPSGQEEPLPILAARRCVDRDTDLGGDAPPNRP